MLAMSIRNVLSIFLFPLAIVYDIITRVRNHLFDIGHKPSFDFETTVISVGNLSVGGTGKTPMTEYLIKLLMESNKISTLSRGYGRRTKGLRFATEEDSAATIGDEPYQFFLKFNQKIKVTVAEDRAFAIPMILHQFPETDIVILDDAFQHRSVKPKFSILVSEYSKPFYTDFVLPYGRLREARKGAKRADVIIITKCPSLTDEFDLEQISHKVKHYAGDKPIFFTAIRYGSPISFGAQVDFSKNVILVSGIANSAHLVDYVRKTFNLIKHIEYPDHHNYSNSDLEYTLNFKEKIGGQVTVLTTEKDMVKLISNQLNEYISSWSWYYLPIETYFLKNGDKFNDLINAKVKSV